MTSQKSLKRRVRARMTKTGERYTTARRQILAGDANPMVASEPPAAEAASPAGSATSAPDPVLARTGRPAEEWFALLDAWGGRDRPHPEIARWLNVKHGVDGWWSQQIAVQYEQAIGRRLPGQMADGTFTVGATKTIAVAVERLFAAWTDETIRAQWLPEVELQVRTSKPNRSFRFDVGDGTTRLIVDLSSKGPGRSTVALAHERLPDADTAAERKAFWRERVTALKDLLEG